MKRVMIILIFSLVLQATALGCTFVYLSIGKFCLAGNNEDWKDPNTFMWFKPGNNGCYGRVYFGYDGEQTHGGMNDQGLCFDGLSTSPNPITRSKDKPSFKGDIMDHIMANCATVDEALAVFEKYNLAFMERFMIVLGDATGMSAIIEGDDVITKDSHYQICTNFYQSQYRREEFPCPRYDIADSLFKNSDRTGPDLIRQILAAVHAEGGYPTLYSNIYDLKNKTITLYHFHNFENGVTLDLREELAKGPHRIWLPDLFPKTYAFEVFFQRKQTRDSVEKLYEQRASISLDPSLLAEYVGRYQLDPKTAPGAVLEVTMGKNILFCTTTKMPQKVEMKAAAKDRFFFLDPNNPQVVDIVFFRDRNGTVMSGEIIIPGVKYSFTRIN